MKRCFLPLSAITILLFSACSAQKKIGRTAGKALLHTRALAGAHSGISIYEPATGTYWYNYQADRYFNPASNTKLFTCYAALKYLGDSLTGLTYRIADDSTVAIMGMGDPSFLHTDFSIHPVYRFLKRFRRVELVQSAFSDYLGPGWAWDDYLYDYMAQRSAFPIYGNTLKISWNSDGSLNFMPAYFRAKSRLEGSLPDGFSVTKLWDSNDFTIHKGSDRFWEIPFNPFSGTLQKLLEDTLHEQVNLVEELGGPPDGVIHSQPTDSLLRPMMHRSDNFYAEQSLLMVSQRLLGEMDDARVIDTLLRTDYRDMPQPPHWVDGSGLSRYNLFTPEDVIFVLEKMRNDFGMERVKNLLPTGGTGTIRHYYLQDSGYIYVKTGSLTGVVALSGYLYTKKNKLLEFSVMVNHHVGPAADVRQAIEAFIQRIRDHF